MNFHIHSFLIATLFTLVGCASVKYEPVLVDSSAPLSDGKSLALQLPCPPKLDLGKTCSALVRADNWYSDTGLRTKPGQRYCIRIPQGQVWFDAGRRNSPPAGESGSLTMNLFKWKKRHDEPWFTLMASIVEFHGSGIQASQVIQSLPPRQFKSLVKEEPFVVTETGALVMYPNDARGQDDHLDYFYANNSGQVWVQITHLMALEACTNTLVS